jgi:signal transduction histidine kinase
MSTGLRLGTLCVIDHKLSYLTSLQKIQQYRFQRRLENLTHMGDLLTNLLDISRVMKAEISKAPIDLTTLIKQNWQRLMTGYKEVEVELFLTKLQ